jgi:hypothetical protein
MPTPPAPEPVSTTAWEYLGIGCLTAVVGLAGGGMIAVLIGKIVGAFTQCAPDTETGAPCNWNVYMLVGAATGFIVVPAVSIWLFRRSRLRNPDPQ